MTDDKEDLQKLINITFEMIFAATSNPEFCTKTREEKAAWVAKVLKDCGFETRPVGASWGILVE